MQFDEMLRAVFTASTSDPSVGKLTDMNRDPYQAAAVELADAGNYCEHSQLTPVKQGPLLAYVRPGEGPGKKRAGKIYGERELAHVLARIDALSTVPESDAVKVLATYRAGLRPSEVAGLTTRTLLNADGTVVDTLVVTGATSKWCKRREIPMHPQLKAAIERLVAAYPDAERVAFRTVKDGKYRYQTADALFLWYAALYLGAGFRGCTGMSGRRSFATALAQYAPLPLVQKLLGHAGLHTTSHYVNEAHGDAGAAILKLGSE
ncbi:MAG: tyrosine-type recombinase/integrase [Blastomonas fulva]|nr:site-specific integrase [Blastomonas sp. AAP25]AOF99552.1 phage integrase family protein [Blastomonas sp. RAC04]